MSFDTEYPNRKDRRKPYRKSAAFDPSCRPHGGCPWCEGNRKHAEIVRKQATEDDFQAWAQSQY